MIRMRSFSATGALLVVVALLGLAAPAPGQVPGVPDLGGAPEPAEAPAKTEEAPAATADNPQATVAEAPGKIDVQQELDVDRVKDFLESTLPKYQGVYDVHAEVDGNVVTLTGHVEDAEVRDKMRDVALKVEGVVFVINKIKTDTQVLSAFELVTKRLRSYGALVGQNWLLFLLAVAMFVLGLMLARLFAAYGEVVLRPITPNALLRSVLVSLISAAIVLAGTFTALQVFGIAQAVLSVLGLAGVAALALGFAFRDIAENFIASILLGVRRPFRVGDYVEVAGNAGLVKALNTRATILVTLEGNHVRIPNATVFKEIIVNKTASPGTRQTFDVLIPYEVSSAKAQEVIGQALRTYGGLLPDPPPRALVEELTPVGVKLRAYYWMPSKGVDGFKIMSDARLKAKVALQQAGIAPPSTGVTVTVAGLVPLDLARVPTGGDGQAPHEAATAPRVSAAQARANLAHDARVAHSASAAGPEAREDTLQQVLENAGGDAATNEGENLLADPDDSEAATASAESADRDNGRSDRG